MKPQLHWSQISMYSRCPEQFRRRYIEGDIVPPGIAIITGTATHKGIAHDLGHKIETGKLAEKGAVVEVARGHVAATFETGDYLLQPEEKDLGPDRVRDAAIDMTVALAALHHAEMAPTVKPKAVERKWVLSLNNFPVDLAGTMDCDEGDIVDDWKTAGKSPNKGAEHLSGQLTMYSMAKHVLDGGEIPRARFGYLIKIKTPKAFFRETTRTKADFVTLLRIIERICEAQEKDVFPFAAGQDPRPWICSKKWCGYYDTCEGVNPRTVVAVK